MREERALVYDIETAPAIGLYFGRTYDVNIAKTIQHEFVLGFAYQWTNEDKIRSCYIWDFPEFRKPIDLKRANFNKLINAFDKNIQAGSKRVVQKWAELVSQSDYVIGHNSDQFDYRQMNGRVIQHGLPPLAKPQFVDTKKIAKRLGYYDSNSLNNLSNRFNHGGKLEHDGIELWWACMNGDTKARKHMVDYNKVDVEKTLMLYEKFRPYDDRHPNLANILDRPNACPHCGVEGQLISNGERKTKSGTNKRWRCSNCGGNCTSRQGEKNEKPVYV